jgi:hypothetical protein
MKETRKAGVRAQTLIAVRDVKASSAWYQTLLGVRSFGIRIIRIAWSTTA